MKRQPHPFKTEADLCAAFIAWAQPQGWTAYAESAGWDILLVHGDGTQIGIQAKLRFNLDVLGQAVEGDYYYADSGPDFRAVLVPAGVRRDLCTALGITGIQHAERAAAPHRFHPKLPGKRSVTFLEAQWHYTGHTNRCALPDYVPDVTAGASGPVQLTEWKCAALRIVAALELRGHVTRSDFKRYGIDHRRWITSSGWLVSGEVAGTFIRGPELVFDKQHPTVYAQVRAEVARELAGMGQHILTEAEATA